jgi:hypothetical protein
MEAEGARLVLARATSGRHAKVFPWPARLDGGARPVRQQLGATNTPASATALGARGNPRSGGPRAFIFSIRR